MDFNELEEAAKPLIDYLYKNYDPNTTIIVKQDSVEVVRTEIGIPLEIRD